PNWCA
ncbi:phosphoglucomutase/phosphomannomutase, alpha/beta/alpha domain I family protein, partial [Escherichia coli 8.0569]